MTLARNLDAVVLAAAWLLPVSQGTFSQANAQAQSPSPGPSDRTTAIPDQKLDAAAAVLERIANLTLGVVLRPNARVGEGVRVIRLRCSCNSGPDYRGQDTLCCMGKFILRAGP